MSDESNIRLGLPSASSMHRYVSCPGSYFAERDLPELPAQDVTKSGTAIHAALESGDDSELQETDAEIAKRISGMEKAALNDWMESNGIEAAPERIAERRLWLRDPKTLDLIASAQLDTYYVHEDKALFLDFKTGFLQTTPAEKNWQVVIQCLCLACEYPAVNDFTGGIAASRLTSKLDLTTYTRNSLRFAMREVEQAVWKANQPSPPRYPGVHCQYCKASGSCVESAAYSSVVLHNQTVSAWSKLGIVESVSRMTPDQLAFVWKRSKIANMVFGAVEDRLKSTSPEQLALIGLKLKPGAVQRNVVDVKAAVAALAFVCPESVDGCLSLSVSKAEAAVGEKLNIPKKNRRDKINEILDGLIVESQNSPSLSTIE